MTELVYAGAYDAEGRIGMICGSTNYEDNVRSLQDAGFINIVPVISDRAGLTHYAATVDGVVLALARPAVELPGTHTIAAGVEWSLPDIPAGTVVRINGVEMGALAENGLVLEFPFAGVREVELEPPFPWMPAKCRVDVS